MPPYHATPGVLDAAQSTSNEGTTAIQEAPGRRLSTQGEQLIGQKLRSGTPHLHHFLQTSPAVTLRANGLSIARFNARRHSSAGLVLHDVKASERIDEAEQRQNLIQTSSSSHLMSPAQKTPLLLVSTPAVSSTPTIEESSCEDVDAIEGEEDGEGFRMQAPVFAEDNSLCTGKISVPVSPRSAPTPWNGDARAVPSVSSPTACIDSSASSVASNSPSDASSDETADTEATSPERSPDGDETPIARVPIDIEKTFKRAAREPPRGRRRTRAATISAIGENADRYGTPEMPRGTAKLPHIPASGLTPRLSVPHYGHAKHLPRAEKLPMSGYELLASTISSTSTTATPSTSAPSRLSALLGTQPRFASRRSSVASFVTSTSSVRSGSEDMEAGPGGNGHASLKPIYRRFEALNHRMLLHMQDELSELEEQLHRLDTTDTQTRRMQSRILPASRRAEHLAGGELQWHKTDILGKIGYKLGQYNHVLSSFAATRDLPAPSLADVNDYRSYLATHQPITEVETRFLDTVDDLVTLAASNKDSPAPTANEEEATSSSSAAATAQQDKLTPEVAQEFVNTFRGHEDVTIPPFPSVTPIPGTMHGNSWLSRHNRVPSIDKRGHARTMSHPDASSQHFMNRRATVAGSTQRQQHQHRRMSHVVWPRPPLSTVEKEETPLLRQPEVSNGEVNIAPSIEESAQVPVQEQPAKPTVKSGNAHVVLHVVIAMAVAVLIPIIAFSAVPGFVGRITVVLLVGLSAMGSVVQSGVVKRNVDSNADMMCITAVYAAVMAVVAGVIN